MGRCLSANVIIFSILNIITGSMTESDRRFSLSDAARLFDGRLRTRAQYIVQPHTQHTLQQTHTRGHARAPTSWSHLQANVIVLLHVMLGSKTSGDSRQRPDVAL